MISSNIRVGQEARGKINMNKQYKIELHGKDLKTGEIQILKFDTIYNHKEMEKAKIILEKVVSDIFTSNERVKIVIIETGGR
jgi:hypothetical protein